MSCGHFTSKQIGYQVSRRVTWQLAWIQPVCISIMSVPELSFIDDSFGVCVCVCVCVGDGNYGCYLLQYQQQFIEETAWNNILQNHTLAKRYFFRNCYDFFTNCFYYQNRSINMCFANNKSKKYQKWLKTVFTRAVFTADWQFPIYCLWRQ